MTARRVILLFVDGVGIGAATNSNPFAGDPDPAPFLSMLLGGRMVAETVPVLDGRDAAGRAVVFKGVDATLGVEGRPQSATGQTAIFTGLNAPQHIGRHLTGFPGGSLRPLIEQHGILKRVRDMGKAATLANAYSPAYFEAVEQRKIRLSVTSRLNMAADLPFRMMPELARGEAVAWDITGARIGLVPPITPEEAGRNLARLGAQHDLTIFETFLTDFAGHKQDPALAAEVLTLFDGFLAGIVAHLSADTTLVITSDHGNLEDLSRKTHTRNPAILLAVGRDAPAFATTVVADLTHIAPAIMRLIGKDSSDFNVNSTNA